MIFIFNHKGSTLAEAILAFSIFISCIVMFVSLLQVILLRYDATYQMYETYSIEQSEKEMDIWQ